MSNLAQLFPLLYFIFFAIIIILILLLVYSIMLYIEQPGRVLAQIPPPIRAPAPPLPLPPPPPPKMPVHEFLLWLVLFLEIGYLCINIINAIINKLMPMEIETIVLAAHESIKLSLPINQNFHILIDSTKDIYVMDGVTIAENTHSLKWESWNYKDVTIITQEDLNLYAPKKLGILALDNLEISKITDECKDILIKIEGKPEPPANFLWSNEKYYLIIKNE